MMTDKNCDPISGVCNPVELNSNQQTEKSKNTELEIIYVGDPMCSWCYGIAPTLKSLRNHYQNEGIPFNIVVGGLRPGGGDPWDDKMKLFLKHHWEQVHERSGQPFSYKLFEKEVFNYNTEPSCRAVVTAREWLDNSELDFFEAIQEKFYAQSEDPNDVEFYNGICTTFNIDFEKFKTKFQSNEMIKATAAEFDLNRQWGVKGYPTVLLLKEGQLLLVANGYSTFETMKKRIDSLLELKLDDT